MNLNRICLLLFVLALVAVPAAADCGAPHGDEDGHGHAAIASKACCAGAAEGTACGPDCPHAQEALKLAEAAENARLFICLQEQIARMNWCPGCGE